MLEILTFSADFLAQRALKRATRELRAAIPDGAEYNEVRNVVNGINDIDQNLFDFLNDLQKNRPTIYDKVINFTYEEERINFMFDFKGKTDKLKALGDEIDLIDAWADVKRLRTERNRISFLKSYKYIAKTTTRNKIINHVINGEVRFNANTGIRKVGGYHLELGANGKILDTIYTDALGHKICTVAIKDGSGNYFTKLDDMGSPVLNDMFRDDWGLDDILENTALAYDNKIYDTGNLYIGIMSDGKKLGMYIGSPTTPITEYASYFISCFPFGF